MQSNFFYLEDISPVLQKHHVCFVRALSDFVALDVYYSEELERVKVGLDYGMVSCEEKIWFMEAFAAEKIVHCFEQWLEFPKTGSSVSSLTYNSKQYSSCSGINLS